MSIFILPKQTSRVISNLNNISEPVWVCFWSYILIFQYYGVLAGLFFHHYFDFLSIETDINNSRLNLINLQKSEVIKRHIPATWLTICLNHFEFDVIWKVFQLLMMLNFQFLYNFHDFRVFAFGYRVQNEKPEITENLYFLDL